MSAPSLLTLLFCHRVSKHASYLSSVGLEMGVGFAPLYLCQSLWGRSGLGDGAPMGLLWVERAPLKFPCWAKVHGAEQPTLLIVTVIKAISTFCFLKFSAIFKNDRHYCKTDVSFPLNQAMCFRVKEFY